MKFRLKQVKPVEAVQWFKDGDHPAVFIFCGRSSVWVNGNAYIKTPDGTYSVQPGDWIVEDGTEIYPCRPDIFAATYELEQAEPAKGESK